MPELDFDLSFLMFLNIRLKLAEFDNGKCSEAELSNWLVRYAGDK